MESMFQSAKSINQDITRWDVENVINMKYVFYNADKFDQNIEKWDGNITQQNYGELHVLSFIKDLFIEKFVKYSCSVSSLHVTIPFMGHQYQCSTLNFSAAVALL